jgi:thioredoxin-like negative regulator of GroEL
VQEFETASDAATFDDILSSGNLIIAKFRTKACVICRRLDPALKQLMERSSELHRLVNIDAEENAVIAKRYHVQAVPTLILFEGDRELARCNGFQTATMLREWINPHLKA